jgi:hypothetical protein
MNARRRPFHRSAGGTFGEEHMNRSEADRSDELEAFRRAAKSDLVIVRNDAAHENIEMSQLRVLCLGIAGMIVADALIMIYFWTI